MYCPKCATQNIDDASFCRGCGADIRLLPQVFQGSLPTGVEQSRAKIERRMSKRKQSPQPARMDKGVRDILKGIGFLSVLIIALIVSRGEFWWTIFLVIPTFMTIGKGIGQIVRAQQEQRQLTMHSPVTEHASFRTASLAGASCYREFTALDTAEMLNNAPPSVTERTTKHLDAPPKSVVKDA